MISRNAETNRPVPKWAKCFVILKRSTTSSKLSSTWSPSVNASAAVEMLKWGLRKKTRWLYSEPIDRRLLPGEHALVEGIQQFWSYD